VTGPHDPQDHREGTEEPWYGTGYDEPTAEHGSGHDEPVAGPGHDENAAETPGYTDPPTQGMHQSAPEDPATVRATAQGPVPEAPRTRWWQSRRVRAGAVGTLAGLILLGGGFGAGYAVAGADTPPPAAATAGAGKAAAKGQGAAKGQAAAKKRRQAEQRRQEQQQQGATPGAPAPGAGAPGAPAGGSSF
jgi:hypothetical protein